MLFKKKGLKKKKRKKKGLKKLAKKNLQRINKALRKKKTWHNKKLGETK